MKIKTWLIICGVVVGVLVTWAVAGSLSSGIPVEVAPVHTGPIHQFVDERGKTRLPETYRITMPYHGRIEPIRLSEDTPVKKGDVVARIVPLDLDLSVKEAAAVVDRLDAQILENADKKLEITALMQAEKFVESMQATVEAAAARQESGKARFDYAEKNLGRIQRLFQKGAQTQDDLDRAALEKVETAVGYRQDLLVYASMQSLQAATDLLPTMVQQYISNKSLAEAVLEKHKAEATAQLRQVEQQQQRGTMRSPVDGVVLSRYSSNERYLAAGTELLEIGRLEDLEIEADILSLDVVGTKENDDVEIYGPAIGRPHAHGTVSVSSNNGSRSSSVSTRKTRQTSRTSGGCSTSGTWVSAIVSACGSPRTKNPMPW